MIIGGLFNDLEIMANFLEIPIIIKFGPIMPDCFLSLVLDSSHCHSSDFTLMKQIIFGLDP